VDDKQKTLARRVSDRNQTLLARWRVRIRKRRGEGIVEDADRFIERDRVLASIGLGLRTIPFEVHSM